MDKGPEIKEFKISMNMGVGDVIDAIEDALGPFKMDPGYSERIRIYMAVPVQMVISRMLEEEHIGVVGVRGNRMYRIEELLGIKVVPGYEEDTIVIAHEDAWQLGIKPTKLKWVTKTEENKKEIG